MANLTSQVNGTLNRRELLKGGLLVGGAAAVGIASLPFSGIARAATISEQSGWTWCKNCQGMFFGPKESISYCPVGGNHYGYIGLKQGSYSYWLTYDTPASSGWQANWNWCNKCMGLFYGPQASYSYCPKDLGHHNGNGSYNYLLAHGQAITNYQRNWNWCNKCRGLFYTASTVGTNICPKDLGHHNGNGSYNYDILYST